MKAASSKKTVGAIAGADQSERKKALETAIKQLFGIVGMPPWNPPIDFKAVKQQGRNSYKFTTLQLWKD